MSEKNFQLILKGKSQMTEKLDKLEKVRLIISLCDWDERLSQIFYSRYIIWCNNADMGCNKFLT